MISAHDALVKARAAYAKNPSHAPRGTYSASCAVTTLDRFAWDGVPERALAAAAGLTDRISIIEWNAASTTDEVLTAFDRAIEATA